MNTAELSIIIVGWNSWDVMNSCIHSIYDTVKARFEIIVIDNNSFDKTVDFLRQAFPEVKILPQAQNLGFSKACNLGFTQSTAEYVLFLNPDVILKKGTVDQMLNFLKPRPDIAIIGPRIVLGNELPDFEYSRKPPSLHADFMRLFLISKVINYVKNKLCAVSFLRDKIVKGEELSMECEFIEGSCLMLRRSTFDALRGFDENIDMYLDDIDICYRARKMGLRNYYLASAEIVHLKQHSTKKAVNPKIYDIVGMEARLHYYRKHYAPAKTFLYKSIIFLSIPYLLMLDLISLPYYLFFSKVHTEHHILKKHFQYFQILSR